MNTETNRHPRICPTTVLVCAMICMCACIAGCRTSRRGPADIMTAQHAIGESSKIPFPIPASHGAGWMEYHGALSATPSARRGVTCLTCHYRDECLRCHHTRLPRDHNTMWRTLSHGFEAGADRARCLTCHRQDYCVRCHNETAPRSHVGSWSDSHCSRCHYDLGATFGAGCSVCHGLYLHPAAPHAIDTQEDCDSCH